MNRVAATIIAAGGSIRLGQPKQLLMVDGEAMLQRVMRLAHEAGASPVLVVLGAHRNLIEERIDLATARVVVNNEWKEGIASSLRAGIKTLEDEAPGALGALLMTCDQPRVTARHLRAMMDAFSHAPDAAVASVYAGTRGIPAVFPRAAFADLLALRGDKGARGLLATPPWPVTEVPLEGGDVDIDRPEDLAQLH